MLTMGGIPEGFEVVAVGVGARTLDCDVDVPELSSEPTASSFFPFLPGNLPVVTLQGFIIKMRVMSSIGPVL